MPNLGLILREEISRLARKEIRQQVGTLKKTNTELRRTVSTLKKNVEDLQRSLSFLQKQEKRRIVAGPKEASAKGVRFSAKSIKSHRKRLGLSAKNYGRLVGVAPLTIYKWESGKSKPRAKQVAAWAEIRGLGKREAKRRLELLGK